MEINGKIVVYKGQSWWNGKDHSDTLIGPDVREKDAFVIRTKSGEEYMASSKGFRFDHTYRS